MYFLFHVENFPFGIDNTQRRIIAYGRVTMMADDPDHPDDFSYVQGGVRVVFAPLEPLKVAQPMTPMWIEVMGSLKMAMYGFSIYYQWNPGLFPITGAYKQGGSGPAPINVSLNVGGYMHSGDTFRVINARSQHVSKLNGQTFVAPSGTWAQTISFNPSSQWPIFDSWPLSPGTNQVPRPPGLDPSMSPVDGLIEIIKWADSPHADTDHPVQFNQQMGLLRLVDETTGRELGSSYLSDNAKNQLFNDVIRFRAEFVRSYQ